MPNSAATGRRYSGINILILWGVAAEHAFTGQSWLTFRQALSLGADMRRHVRAKTSAPGTYPLVLEAVPDGTCLNRACCRA
jgi:antirestriction protein ArdC